MARGSAGDRRTGEPIDRWDPSATSDTPSERGEEAERSEGPQDTCYQIPLCPFHFSVTVPPFHGWSLGGSLEYQGKRAVPSRLVPLPPFVPWGYGAGCLAWSSRLLAVLLFRRSG
jgi:hypothetical protein